MDIIKKTFYKGPVQICTRYTVTAGWILNARYMNANQKQLRNKGCTPLLEVIHEIIYC